MSVLDLGSNSFHVLVADVDETGMVVPVAREREMLHLGAVVAEHGSIPDDVRADAVAVVAHFTALATRLGAEQRLAVATSALRDADNGPSVVAHMEIAADTTIRVIDGHEEGELAFAGVAASLGAATSPRLMLDLGGGSLELAVGTGHTVDHATTFPVGVSRLAGMLADDPPSKKDVTRLRQHVREVLAPAIDDFPLDDVTQVVAVGGTVRALARVAAARAGRWLPATLNLLHLERAQFTDLRKRLTRMDRDDRLDEPGMKAKRADHVHVAATIVDTVLRELGIDEVVVSDWGLREGVLLQARAAVPPALPELREREVVRMQQTFLPDDPHLDHVGGLAARLFDATTDLHDLDEADRDLLVAGARLHGVGQSLALRRQHHHGAYLIEHMELRGFSPRETAMLCCMARFHSTRGMSAKFPAFAAMDDTDREVARQLVALVQVADGLDRARDQAVDDVEVRRNRDVVGLRLRGDQLHVAVEEVQRRTAFFEQVFDVTVVVTVAPAGPTA
nr:Ppx/GppA phosphatase family protein [Salsipaludibacter albus]